MNPTDQSRRPRRYPHDRYLSTIVDQLTDRAEQYRAAGDDVATMHLDRARQIVLDVALGVPPEEPAP